MGNQGWEVRPRGVPDQSRRKSCYEQRLQTSKKNSGERYRSPPCHCCYSDVVSLLFSQVPSQALIQPHSTVATEFVVVAVVVVVVVVVFVGSPGLPPPTSSANTGADMKAETNMVPRMDFAIFMTVFLKIVGRAPPLLRMGKGARYAYRGVSPENSMRQVQPERTFSPVDDSDRQARTTWYRFPDQISL